MSLELPVPEIEPDPFEDIVTSLSQASDLEQCIDNCVTPDLPPDALLALADAKSGVLRQRKLLLRDWNWQLSQTYPASS